MKRPSKKTFAFTLVELLAAIAIIVALIWLSIPWIQSQLIGENHVSLLGNARQLHLATQTMALDTLSTGGNGREWTSVSSHGKKTPASLAAYFEALTKNNYLTESDLKKLLTGPGKGPGKDAPAAENICFRFFQVDEASPSDQPLLVSANWRQRKLTSEAPYGKKGFVVFAKGGSGGICKGEADAASVKIFPAINRGEGSPYRYNMLE